jgi:hypothetical protein
LTVTFYLFATVVGLLLAVFGWSLRALAKRSGASVSMAELEDFPRQHVTYFAQMRQALRTQDSQYLSARGMPKLARQIQTERRRVALRYLAGIRQDFQKLLRLARVIAVLSPEVNAVQEYERFKLTLQFAWRYRLAYLSLKLGHSPLPLLMELCHVVSGLSVRVEGIITCLGEQAAAGFDLGSTFERRGLDNT